MRRILSLALIAALPASAVGQTTKKAQTPTRAGVAEDQGAVVPLLTAMNYAYVLCPIRISTVAINYNLSAMRGESVDPASSAKQMSACTDSLGSAIDSLFRAAKRQRLSPKATDMLKDIMADWRSSIPALQPSPLSEAVAHGGDAYMARTGAIRQAFSQKSERLKLEIE